MLRILFSLTTALLFTPLFLTMTAMPLHAASSPEQAIQDLQSSDPAVQMQACRVLGAARLKTAVNPLVNLMESTTDQYVAASAAAALGAIGEKGVATTALLKATKNNDFITLQYAALLALVVIKDEHHQPDTLNAAKAAAESEDPFLSDLGKRVQPLLAE